MTNDQLAERVLLIEKLKGEGLAYIPLIGGPFDGELQQIPPSVCNGMYLKKVQLLGEQKLVHVQHIYKLEGLSFVYQGECQYD